MQICFLSVTDDIKLSDHDASGEAQVESEINTYMSYDVTYFEIADYKPICKYLLVIMIIIIIMAWPRERRL